MGCTFHVLKICRKALSVVQLNLKILVKNRHSHTESAVTMQLASELKEFSLLKTMNRYIKLMCYWPK